MTLALDGTSTGYEGTYPLSASCETTVDLAEMATNVETSDGTAMPVGRDKSSFGTTTVVVWSDAVLAPAHVGLTSLGWAGDCDAITTDVPEVAGVRVWGPTIWEEADETECVTRFGEGVRGGTHMVNITVSTGEVTGPSPLGLVVLFVADCCWDLHVCVLGEVAANSTW